MGLFGKKGDSGDGDEANRAALFGSRSKAKSPAATNPYAQPPPASDNPYAQPSAPSRNPYAQPAPSAGNPYANAPPDPYASAKQNAYDADPYLANTDKSQGGYGGGNNNRYGGDSKSPAFTGTMAGGGYGANKVGNQSGYGSDRYGTASANQGPSGGSRTGGYGGLGGDSFASKPDDEARNALFGGAQERQQRQQQTGGYAGAYGGAPPPYENENQGWGGNQAGGYGSYNMGPKYDDRQLTAEEEEEESIQATKQQIKFTKQQDVATTRNALRTAQMAEEVGRDTLARLGVQGEHIHNTEKYLDLAHNQNKVAEEKARELKTLNRSMFAIHVSNPFTASKRDAARDREVIEKHVEQREQREATRQAAYLSEQRMQKRFQDMQNNDTKKREKNLAERAKYQFEADSEDEQMEDEIDTNLDALAGVTSRLNALARATGEEVDIQNKHLDRISEKGDKVDVGLASNRARLDRIR